MTKALVTSALAAAALLSGTAAFAATKPQPHPTPTKAATRMAPAKASAAKTTRTVKATTAKKTG